MYLTLPAIPAIFFLFFPHPTNPNVHVISTYHSINQLLWVPISSTGKVSCRRVRELGSNLVYTKNQLMSWPDGKSNHHERTP
jgi:hypothetical protein